MKIHRFCLSILFLILPLSVYSYEGEADVEELFSEIKDLAHPTLEEFRAIENFLKFGNRPFLKPFYVYFKQSNDRSAIRRMGTHLMLVGKNGEMPQFEIHKSHQPERSDRCILLYSTFNSPYPEKARQVFNELKISGFQGDILLRIGGYPHMNHGGIKLCHIPYSWKIAFLHEAKELGYKKILWLDTSMHPLNNLEYVFQLIEEKGYLLLSSGINLDFPGHHFNEALEALNISSENTKEIPHIISALMGFDLNNRNSNIILEEWLAETKKVLPYLSRFPEELSLSVVAWRNQIPPIFHWGLLVCINKNIHQRFFFPNWSFLLDLNRIEINDDLLIRKG